METERFSIAPDRRPGYWVATDRAAGIVVTFRQGAFNETQHVDLLPNGAFATSGDYDRLPAALRELGAWVCREHNAVALPPRGDTRTDVGQQLRALRLARGWTLDDLAARSGLTAGNLKKMEDGRYNMRLDSLSRAAAALGAEIRIIDGRPTL